jgi:hypothetical protein
MALPATDGFAGFEIALSASWTIQTPSPNDTRPRVANNYAGGAGAGIVSGAFWNADTFDADQYSQGRHVDSANNPGVGVRLSGTGSNWDGYAFLGGTLNRVYRVDDAVFTSLQSGHSSVNLDVLRLEASGSSLQAKVNGVASLSNVADATYATGAAGIQFYETGGLDDWEGGNLVTYGVSGVSQMNLRQFPKAFMRRKS